MKNQTLQPDYLKKSVFKWHGDFKEINLIFLEILGKQKIREMKKNRPDYYSDGETSWLCTYTNNLYKNSDEIREIILKNFKNKFEYIRGYHACKVVDINSYYEHGLIPLDYENQAVIFKRLALESGHSLEKIDNTIKKVNDYIEVISMKEKRREICFVLDQRRFYELKPTQLFSGNEYIRHLITQIDDPSIIKKIDGVATVFEVNIPISKIDSDQMKTIMGLIATEWVSRKIYKNNPNVTDRSINISDKLDPSYIYRHYHPKNLLKGSGL